MMKNRRRKECLHRLFFRPACLWNCNVHSQWISFNYKHFTSFKEYLDMILDRITKCCAQVQNRSFSRNIKRSPWTFFVYIDKREKITTPVACRWDMAIPFTTPFRNTDWYFCQSFYKIPCFRLAQNQKLWYWWNTKANIMIVIPKARTALRVMNRKKSKGPCLISSSTSSRQIHAAIMVLNPPIGSKDRGV